MHEEKYASGPIQLMRITGIHAGFGPRTCVGRPMGEIPEREEGERDLHHSEERRDTTRRRRRDALCFVCVMGAPFTRAPILPPRRRFRAPVDNFRLRSRRLARMLR